LLQKLWEIITVRG